MGYMIVKSQIDIDGNIRVIVEVPDKFVLPSTKYKYDPNKRDLSLKIVKAYFMTREMLDKIKENAALDFKDRYGEEIHIAKLEIIDVKLENGNVIVTYNAKLKNKRKPQNRDIVV